MGLGIKDYDNIYTSYSIPLVWEEKSILAEHLRHLADTIDKMQNDILEIRLTTPISYPERNKPHLELITFREDKKWLK